MAASNRFEELFEKQAELEVLLDDPDVLGSTQAFLDGVRDLTRESADLAAQLTEEDFDAEYEEEGDTTGRTLS